MNSITQGYYAIFAEYQAMRNQLMAILTDDDLDYHPGGANRPLGLLCRAIGETEHAYIQSFKTFKLDLTYRNEEPGLAKSVENLTAWFEKLDGELKAVVAGLSEDDIQNKVIDRGPDFTVKPFVQLEIYKEAMLIFYGKVSIYLRAMGKPMPQQWQAWLG